MISGFGVTNSPFAPLAGSIRGRAPVKHGTKNKASCLNSSQLIRLAISILPMFRNSMAGFVEPFAIFRESGNFRCAKELVSVAGWLSQGFEQSGFEQDRNLMWPKT